MTDFAADLELAAEGLGCERGGRRVFAGVSFRVGRGGALLVTGPNGAGKSSLLRTIAGLVRAASGAVRLAGGDADLSVGRQCHYFGHQDALKPALTVAENLEFWRVFNRPTGLATEAALTRVGIDHLADLPAAYLSAGQRRRLALARLLVSLRPVWLMDEPQSALDAASEARLAELMAAHRATGGIIVAATHQPLLLDRPATLRLLPAGIAGLDGAGEGDDADGEVAA